MAETASSLKCPRCSFVGKSVQSLKVHMAIVHKRGRRKKAKAGLKRVRARGVRCSTCGKILKTPAALKAHVTRMHKGRAWSKKKGRRVAAKTGAASALDRRLMNLSLAEVADLHDACRKELGRRLADIVG